MDIFIPLFCTFVFVCCAGFLGTLAFCGLIESGRIKYVRRLYQSRYKEKYGNEAVEDAHAFFSAHNPNTAIAIGVT